MVLFKAPKYGVLILLLLNGCTLKPDIQVNKSITVPNEWLSHQAINPQVASSQSSSLFQNTLLTESNEYTFNEITWLKTLFGDDLHHAVLNGLKTNHNLIRQAKSVNQANLSFKDKQSAYYPDLDLSLEMNRRKTARYNTNLNLLVDSQMTVDIWGKLSDQEKQQQYKYWQQVIRYQDMQFSFAMNVAKAQLNLLKSEEIQQLLSNKVDNLYQIQATAERLYKRGLVDLSSVYNARKSYRSAQSGQLKEQNSYLEQKRKYAILMGHYPSTHLRHQQAFSLPSMPPMLPDALPSELLKRRADLRLAWLNVLNQQIQVAVKHKDRFPSFSLKAEASSASNELSTLLDLGQVNWLFKTRLATPIFKYGQLKRAQQSAQIEFEKVEVAYLSAAYNAFLQVENALSQNELILYEIETAEQVLDNSLKDEKLAKSRYQQGLNNYNNLLFAQRRLIDSQIQIKQLKFRQFDNYLNLFSALGGDWSIQNTTTQMLQDQATQGLIYER